MIVLCAAYRMTSADADPKGALLDPDDRLLHRMRMQRLEAEAIRDAILAVSGRLNERLEGPSVPVHLDEFMTGRGRPSHSGPLDGDGRRSLYLGVRRNFLTPMFLSFDYPTPFTTAGRRATSNIPAQALTLMNNPFVLQQAHCCGERLAKSACAARSAEKADAIIDELYETALGRLPSRTERNAAREFVTEQTGSAHAADAAALSALSHVLFNVKEFIYVN
jgi:hypothetical protein